MKKVQFIKEKKQESVDLEIFALFTCISLGFIISLFLLK